MVDWGDSVLPTVDQIRSIGEYGTPPTVTGLDYIDSSYTHKLHAGGSIAFSIDATSAIAHGHDPNDLRIIIRVPGVDNETCDNDAVVDYPVLTFQHVGELGIYGPEDPLTNSSWAGSNGATTPDEDGTFTVTDTDGRLTLDIPCNFSWLLDDVPNQNFPTGMPGMPTIAYYHRSDLYREYDGQLGQDGTTVYHIPAEGIWCWRGFSTLKIPITGCSGRTMTMRLNVRTHSHVDTHVTDSTRQEDYEHSYSDTWYTFTAVAGESDVVFALAIEAVTSDPDLEQVMTVEFYGFPVGALQLGEPKLGPDPVASRILIKSFEGTDFFDTESDPEWPHAVYQEGGFSAIVSPTYTYALIDNAEDNAGHDNQAELTVRNFDYREGAMSGLDLTVAWSLSAIAGLLDDVCNAWSCSVDETEFDTMTLDDEDPANRLTSLYAFDVAYPDCEIVDADDRENKPLIQGEGGALNCSIRCGSWSIAPGILYAIRTDKVIGGAAHGLARTNNALVRSYEDAFTIWRKPKDAADTEWEVVESGIDVDNTGMWNSSNLQEYNPDDEERWDYAVDLEGKSSPPSYDLGHAYLREYCAVSPYLLRLIDLYLHITQFGFCYRIYHYDDAIRIKPSYGLQSLQDPVTVAATSEDDGDVVSVYGWSEKQKLIVGAQFDGGNERMWVSLNGHLGPFTELGV